MEVRTTRNVSKRSPIQWSVTSVFCRSFYTYWAYAADAALRAACAVRIIQFEKFAFAVSCSNKLIARLPQIFIAF